jgi:hypothetical protein
MDLAKKLQKTYIKAPKKEVTVAVFLFGVRYRKQLERENIKEIVKQSKIPFGFVPEIYKGMALSKYVTFK